jgi:DNA-directed RNA polymerase subunit H (RpoH/RPB5)
MTVPLKRRVEKSLGPLFDPLYLFYLLVDDLKSWRYFPKWFSSFRPGRSFIGEAKPWIPFEAANWLEHYLKPHMKVFEYGSGGSTIFFAERVAEVFSIEHDQKWHTLVSRALARRGITNCTYQLHEPIPIAGTSSAPSEIADSQNSRFIYDDYYAATLHEYVEDIDVHPDHTFDLVLVDGRVRTECIQHALPKIKPAGYLMLDNSNNADVVEIIRKLQTYPHTEFRGIAPGWPPTRWSNTIWQIT